MKRTPSNVLVQLRFTGDGMFNADAEWRKRAASSFCPRCHNIREGIQSIDATVLPSHLRFDIGSIGPASVGFKIVGACYRVRILSTKLIDVVGIGQVERIAGLGHVSDTSGKVLDRYRTAVARRDPVIARGYRQEGVGLCKECGRLLYGARDEYVLRQDLPPEPFFLSDGRVYCTDEFWSKCLVRALKSERRFK